MIQNVSRKLTVTTLILLFFVTVFFVVKDLFSKTTMHNISSPLVDSAEYDTLDNIVPIPEKVNLNPEKVALGEKLFFDANLSKDGTVACVSCHLFQFGTTDRQSVSMGVDNQKGTLNSPPIFNARYNIAQFWDGRAKDLFDQIHGPMTNPVEMGNFSLEEVVKRLQEINYYKTSFKSIYTDGITQQNIKDAIVEYEKSLITPNSRFDQFLKGDNQALSSEEKAGYQLFKSLGCIACHNGINIGGNIFQKAGIFQPISDKSDTWTGRYKVTGNPDDLYYLKVPSLRNIAHTAPYFHDGSSKTLSEAIAIMAENQLGRTLSNHEIDLLEKFLITLTGKYKGKFVGTPN